MEQLEARGKLASYESDYGPWVYTATLEQIYERAGEYEADIAVTAEGVHRNTLQGRAIQLRAIAACREVLGADVKAPETADSNVVKFPGKDDFDIVFVPEGRNVADFTDMDDDDTEVTMDELLNAPQPVHKIGDRLWTHDYEGEDVVGYVPVVIVGIDLGFDMVLYMVGEEIEPGVILTNFEVLEENELFASPEADPKFKPEPVKEKGVRGHLRLVAG